MKKQRPAQSRVTLANVARDAGVSITTVSLILGNRDGWIEQFHPDTVQRVRSSAERLGYRRNLFASGLPSGDSPFFALVLREADANVRDWSCWAFQGALLEGVSAAAEGQGVYSVVTSLHGRASGGDPGKASAIIDGGVFGTIFQSPRAETEELILAQLGRRRPVVVIFPERTASWPTNAIDMDNLAAGRTSGQLLAAAKREHWAMVRYERMTEAHQLRCEGLTQVARESGVNLITISLPLEVDEDNAAELLATHLERGGVDAVYAVDSVASVAALRGCLRAGLSPGGDCLIVGCDASQWKIPGLPRITSVDVSWRQIGAIAVEQLLRARMSNGRFRTVLLKPRIVEADTCPAPTGKRRLGSASPCRLAC